MIPYETAPRSAAAWSPKDAVLHFLTAPLRARSYANFLYLALAFPLGLAYFVFLIVGFSLGLGLTIVWIGLPILAAVFALSWGAVALERFMAIQMLGAEVPPMAPAAPVPPTGFWNRIGAFLSNPVTWKGLGFLLLKFPLGIATFVVTVFLVALTGAFLSAPFVAPWQDVSFGLTVGDWEVGQVDTLGESLACFGIGLVLALISFNLLNGLGTVWKHLASFLLGSPRFSQPGATPAAGGDAGIGGGAGGDGLPQAMPA